MIKENSYSYRADANLCAKNKLSGAIGVVAKEGTEANRAYGVYGVSVNGEGWKTNPMTDQEFDLEWEMLDYAINGNGQKIEVGSIWFVSIPKSKYWPTDESWIFQIERIGQFGPTLRYVNWKRKGSGCTSTFGLDDLDTDGGRACRPATPEEIKYFKKRRGGK